MNPKMPTSTHVLCWVWVNFFWNTFWIFYLALHLFCYANPIPSFAQLSTTSLFLYAPISLSAQTWQLSLCNSPHAGWGLLGVEVHTYLKVVKVEKQWARLIKIIVLRKFILKLFPFMHLWHFKNIQFLMGHAMHLIRFRVRNKKNYIHYLQTLHSPPQCFLNESPLLPSSLAA